MKTMLYRVIVFMPPKVVAYHYVRRRQFYIINLRSITNDCQSFVIP